MGAPAIYIPRDLLIPLLLVAKAQKRRPQTHLYMFAVRPSFTRLHWQVPGYSWRVSEITTFSREMVKIMGQPMGLSCLRRTTQLPSIYFLDGKSSITTKAVNDLSANASCSVWKCCWTPHLLCSNPALLSFLAPPGMPVSYPVGCSKHFLLHGKEQHLLPTLARMNRHCKHNSISSETEPIWFFLRAEVYLLTSGSSLKKTMDY